MNLASDFAGSARDAYNKINEFRVLFWNALFCQEEQRSSHATVQPTLRQLYAEGQAVADVGHAPALHNILSGKDQVERSSLYSLDQHFLSPSCDSM